MLGSSDEVVSNSSSWRNDDGKLLIQVLLNCDQIKDIICKISEPKVHYVRICSFKTFRNLNNRHKMNK